MDEDLPLDALLDEPQLHYALLRAHTLVDREASLKQLLQSLLDA